MAGRSDAVRCGTRVRARTVRRDSDSPLFPQDPPLARSSERQLRAVLLAPGVALPAEGSTKQLYAELHLRHITCARGAALSNNDNDGGKTECASANIPAGEAQRKELDVMDVSWLTDEELKIRLLQLGVTPGPIVGDWNVMKTRQKLFTSLSRDCLSCLCGRCSTDASTRALYEKKLMRLLSLTSNPTPTSTVDTNQYYNEDEDDCSGSEYAGSETVKGVEQSVLIDSKVGECSLGDDSYYPRCFLPPSRLWQRHDSMLTISSEEDPGTSMDSTAERAQALVASPVLPTLRSNTFTGPPPSQGVKPLCMSLDGGFVVTTSLPGPTFSIAHLVEEESPLTIRANFVMERRKPNCNKVPMEGISSEQRLRDKSHVEPMQDVLREMFPDMVRTPTGISATCRRPIKGAAGRPVQFKYPNTPSSPGTKEREELQRQLVPVWIQIVVFLLVASFLYLIYGATTDGLINPFTALIPACNHNGGDMEEVQALSAPQDPAVPFLGGED